MNRQTTSMKGVWCSCYSGSFSWIKVKAAPTEEGFYRALTPQMWGRPCQPEMCCMQRGQRGSEAILNNHISCALKCFLSLLLKELPLLFSLKHVCSQASKIAPFLFSFFLFWSVRRLLFQFVLMSHCNYVTEDWGELGRHSVATQS